MVLTAAKEAVGTFRNSVYGEPEDAFNRIGQYWSLYLQQRFPCVSSPITEHDVAAMMILMKLARLVHDPNHLDSVVDIAGYAACWGDFVADSFVPGKIVDTPYDPWTSGEFKHLVRNTPDPLQGMYDPPPGSSCGETYDR